ncbi:hypothetical protein F2P81_004327 [Scophthalmus maximus]|uniref:Uncharacterized protein n=1 Tax=Scophthalmus maximus TaxID=52904 RepID=A0A6A4TGU2_SCOMX|nr:hypothetical protein F2P81_004327 [Scophthalmus maximus]
MTLEEQPAKSTVSERAVRPPLSLRVVDSYGEWTALWESQFTALSIPHLRSHTLVHTDPLSQKALQEFVLKCDRSVELHSLPDQVYILDEYAFFNDMRLGKKEKKRLNVTSTLKKSLSFSLPGTKLSVDFFKDQDQKPDHYYSLSSLSVNDDLRTNVNMQVERYNLGNVLVKGTVEHIIPVVEREDEENDRTKERDTEGEATRATERMRDGGRRRLKHFQVHLHGGIVLKAHRVIMATGPTRAQMANIPSWVKNVGESYPEERLQHTLKQFDVGDVESLVGRYSHVEHGIKMDGQAYLRQFYNERSLHKRLAMIRQARKGGAVTPEAYIQLQPFIRSGQVDVKTYCQVSEASWCYRSQAWSLSLSTGAHWTGDMIWLATGCKLDVKQDPLLSEVIKEFPIQVGPHAVNLAGGQAASMRIAKDIRRQQPSGDASDPSGEKSKTEEYIQQMRGLLWL